ncbi:MAG: DNA-processing protein DprA [Candidatus Neomarinimicrobiota bacterium]
MDISTLSIMCVEDIGPRTYFSLIQAFGSAEAVLQQDKSSLMQVKDIRESQADAIVNKIYQKMLERQLEQSRKKSVKIITYGDEDYPDILRQIYNPPLVLLYQGEFSEKDDPAFGIVGMRYPDDYGKQMCYTIASDIAKKDICIVSGMAKGIDSIAHRAALDHGARTIAVMGTSFDIIYPAENKHLYREIRKNGIVCTETLFGRQQVPAHFVRRNRIISGLSRGVLVVQAGHKSGALVTAFNANEQNRDVFAVPGDVLKGRHTGCHRLIKLGAKIVEKSEDILCEYPFIQDKMKAQGDLFIQGQIKKKLSKEEESVLTVLNKEGVHIDMIFYKCDLDRAAIMKALLDMELKGYIKRGKGNYYSRNI